MHNYATAIHESGHAVTALAMGFVLREVFAADFDASGYCKIFLETSDQRAKGRVFLSGFLAEEIASGVKINIIKRTGRQLAGSDLWNLNVVYGMFHLDDCKEYLEDKAEVEKDLRANWKAVEVLALAAQVHGTLTRTKILAALDKAGIGDLPGIKATRKELEFLQESDREQAELDALMEERAAREKFNKFCEEDCILF